MPFDETSGRLPTLVGAPAYARPPALVEAPRPFDPDELPLEIDQTEEERAFAARLPARAFAPGGGNVRNAEGSTEMNHAGNEMPPPSRSRSLRGITRFWDAPRSLRR